jgi:hypothetical protein
VRVCVCVFDSSSYLHPKNSIEIIRRFITTRIIDTLQTEGEFWRNQSISIGDWRSLAEQILKDIFSIALLDEPLESLDDTFRLEVDQARVGDVLSLLVSNNNELDLDRARPVVLPVKEIEAIVKISLPASISTHQPYSYNDPNQYYHGLHLPHIVMPVLADGTCSATAIFGPRR